MPLTAVQIARRTASAMLALLAASPAAAHFDPSLAGGWLAGLSHPVSGPDHLLAMVAVGLWGAFLGRPLIYLLPVVFPTVMALGGALAMVHAPMPPVEIGIALSVLMLGGAIAGAVNPPVWVAALLVGVFALFHGYAHGRELPSIADPVAFSAGFVVTTGLLHLVGIAVGGLSTWRAGATVVRVLGGLIALAGIGYLYAAMA